jgi:uncharacterized protein (TIGR03435 family)
MKHVIRCLAVVLVTLWGSVANAQSLAGNWQGTLQAGKELRVVVVLSGEGSAMKAMMHVIDQGGQGIPASSTTLQGTSVRIEFPSLGVILDGSLNAARNAITGTFTQGGKPLPITLARATPDTAWVIPELPKPMAADAKPVFEVATIKPSNPERQGGKLFTVKGRQVITINTSVNDLVTMAYGLHVRQLIGGPEWMGTEMYDVTGQPEAQGIPNQAQLAEMIKGLLADRFKLAFHRETRELPAYAIVVGPGGHKLTKNDSNPNGLPSLLFRGLGVLPVMNATIGDFAGVMQFAVLDRPVVDKTGLQGRWDFTLRWTPDESQFAGLGVRVPPPSNDPNAPPGFFTAVQEQLGLRVESTKAPVEVLVVDRVEKPSEN